MSATLQNMQAKRIFDAADLHAFVGLGGRQVYGQEGSFPAIPAGFLVPYLLNGRWNLTVGFVEGVKFSGSDAPLSGLRAGVKVWAVVHVQREVVSSQIGQDVEGNPIFFSYVTGRYIIDTAEIQVLPGTDPGPDEVTGSSALTSELLFTCDDDGNPPLNTSSPHYRIDVGSLTF